MIRNLFGELQLEPADFTKKIRKSFSQQSGSRITPNFETSHGFYCDGSIDMNTRGIYCIYKNDKPIYIGYALGSTIRNRISRFIAGARGTQRVDESHSAGEKYSKYFNDYSDLTVKIHEVDTNLLNKVTMPSIEDVEDQLIFELKPTLNKQIRRREYLAFFDFELENEK